MSNGTPDHDNPSDAPWRDSPADSDAIPGTEEPDPAEVVGDDGDERDRASPRLREPDDVYQHDTLDERLAEEEPEAVLHGSRDAQAGEFQAPEHGGDDLIAGEADSDPDDDPDELGAEDAAMHIHGEG
jgi:hypothetical protein